MNCGQAARMLSGRTTGKLDSRSGIAFPLSSPHQIGIGRFEVVSGTGAYAGLTGHGTFQIVVDATSNQLMGTEIATVRQ